MRVVLIEATPWDGTGAAANVYLAGGGSRGYDHRGRTTWKGGIVRDPKFTGGIGYDESGWTGGSTSQTTRIEWFAADKATMTTVLGYQWKNAPITVLAGDDAAAAPVWTTLISGTVVDVKQSGGSVEFTIADMGVKLLDPFLVAKFGGTGGVDGDTAAEGRFKRRTFGKAFNVEGFILNKASNIYEFGDPANPLNAFTAVRDFARVAAPAPTVVAWQGSIAATYAALQASSPAQGSCVVAPSIACVKWWTQPYGPLTADIQGEVGAGYVNTVVTIAQRLVTAAGLAWTAPTASVLAAPAGTAEAGIHVADNGESLANLLDRLLLGAGLVWVLDPAGSVQAREFTLANPVETIPIVDTITRAAAYRACISRRVAYQRSYRIHTDGEISAAVKTADVEGLGGLATKDSVAFNDGTVKTSGGVTATDAAYQTGQGISLAVANQAPAATDPTIDVGATRTSQARAVNDNSEFGLWVGNVALRWDTTPYGRPGTITRRANSANSTRGTDNIGLVGATARYGDIVPVSIGETWYVEARYLTTTNGSGTPTWYIGADSINTAGLVVGGYYTDGTAAGVGGPVLLFVAGGAKVCKFKITIPAGSVGLRPLFLLDGAGAVGEVDYIALYRDEPGATVGADLASNIVDSGSASPTVAVPRNEIRTPLGISLGFANQSWFATTPTLSLEDSTHLINTTRISKLAAADGRVSDPTILNTQLLLGPRSATDVIPAYTVGGSNVTVSLPSHNRTVAGASGKVTITIGASSGVVAFSTYWAAYIDLATIANVPSPSVTFTTDPTDLLNSPNRLQLSSGIAPNAAGSGGSTTGGGGSGSVPRTGGGVYP